MIVPTIKQMIDDSPVPNVPDGIPIQRYHIPLSPSCALYFELMGSKACMYVYEILL